MLSVNQFDPALVSASRLVVEWLVAESESKSGISMPETYPRPRIPLLPLLSWRTLFARQTGSCGSTVLDAGRAIDTTSGRAAIAVALKYAGVQAGDKVLVPAFHCQSMIEPIKAMSAVPVYFRIHEDTSIDVEDMRARADGATRAVIVPHYFGFPQNMPAIRQFCDTFGLALIEDCAHAFFGVCHGYPMGWYGDYAIASAKKFFPVYDGGFLISSRHPLDPADLEFAGWMFNAKAALNALEYAGSYGRLKVVYAVLALPIRLQKYLWTKAKSASLTGALATVGPKVSSGYKYLDTQWINKRMSGFSRGLIAMTSKAWVVRRRRENYNKLVAALSDLPKGRPLLPYLPNEVTPYMFPFLVDEPERVFPRLKRLGVPIYRWEDIEATTCDISRSYAQRLLQLPCHQDLRAKELDWMIECLKSTLTDPEAASNN